MLVELAYNIYFFMIIVYILLSWLPNAQSSAIGQWIAKLVEPYLSIFRRFIPPIGGVIDLSPIVAIFCLYLIKSGLYSVIGFLW
ncbi:MAG: YggT family protein [Paenibacillaceae bacterium]|nr:YggT family protein [Paenibacillaceae bacterium]